MKGFADNFEKPNKDNDHFRQVLYMGYHLQLVRMTIQPGEGVA